MWAIFCLIKLFAYYNFIIIMVMTLFFNYNYKMWLSFAKTKEIFWKEKATEMFNSAWISIREKWDPKDSQYRKLSESAHWKILHQYLKDIEINHTHIGNEAWQSWTKNIIIMMAKKKAQWTSAWFPDYLISIPTLEWYITLCIELKKARWVNWGLNGSEIKKDQIEWQKIHNRTLCTYTRFAHGSNEAIEIVDEFIKEFINKSDKECLYIWQTRSLVYQEYINYLEDTLNTDWKSTTILIYSEWLDNEANKIKRQLLNK